MDASSKPGTTFSMPVDDDMRLRQKPRQIAIALVGDDDRGAVSATRKFAPVMPASAASKWRRRHGARLGDQRGALVQRRVRRQPLMCALRKLLSTSAPSEMKGGRDDMARRFVAKLDDVFAKIGFDRRDAIGFEDGH